MMNSGRKNISELIEGYRAGNLSIEETEMLFTMMADEPSVVDNLLTDNLPQLKADEIKYPFHSNLLKSYSDLPDDQFEYLCIASAEGDLDRSQREELEIIADKNSTRKATLITFERLRMKPDRGITYPDKASLKKTTPFAGIIRVGSVVLGAAASVAVLVMAFYLFTDNRMQQATEMAETTVPPVITTEPEKDVAENPVIAAAVTPVTKKAEREQRELQVPEESIAVTEIATAEENFSPNARSVEPVSGTIAALQLSTAEIPVQLADVYTGEPVAYHGPLSLKDHIAITFREKLLGEEIPDASPLKAVEIASAGVMGLNKILGWEMALEVSKEEKGRVNALAFSSRLLRFQTPLKKNDISE